MRALVLGGLLAAACGPPLQQARLSNFAPPSDRELEAAERIELRSCNPAWKWLLPGMGQICLREPGEGAATMTAFFAEVGAAVAVDQVGSSAQAPLFALQDVYLYGVTRPTLDQQLALRLPFVPPETTAELLVAPFRGRVLARPDVWLGILLAAGLALTTEALIGELPPNRFGDDPILFSHRLDPGLGYPLGGLTLAGTFEHVAVAEEALFRGYLQSGLARACGEGCGHAWASVLFGIAHVPNVLTLQDAAARERYLAVGVPFITLTGAYMGWVYRRSGYALSTSVAIHFWYDFILGFGDFLLEPQRSPFLARVTIPF